MTAFACDRCGTTFEDALPRCPKCLRKSTVREVGRASSEAARLAAGDHTQTTTARRATALWIALTLSAVLGVVLSLAWGWLADTHLLWPAIVGMVLSASAFITAAVRGTDGWRAFARRCGVAAAVGAWAFVSGTLALITTAGLSIAFTLAMSVVTFGGGLIPVLQWLRSREDTPARPPGKWR